MWITRPVKGDEYTLEINLSADPDAKVPLTVGQTLIPANIHITETRMYSIRELIHMTKIHDA